MSDFEDSPKFDDERLLYATLDTWRGQEILMACWSKPCRDHQHTIEVLHHIDDEEKHFCPTGFIWCITCGAIADEPDPPECDRYGN